MSVTEAEARPVVGELHAVPPATHDDRATLRGWWSDSLVFAWRNVEHIRQIPEKLLDVTLQPLMFVLLFAYVFGGAIAVHGGSYREYIVAGILAQSLAFGLTGPATAIATDLDRRRDRPLPFTSGRAVRVRRRSFPRRARRPHALDRGAARRRAGWSDGASTPISCTSPPARCCCSCSLRAMIWIGTWVGLLVRSADAVMGLGFAIVFPLTFLSSAFVPISSMPTFLQWIASWNPFSVVVGAIRELFGNPVAPTTQHAWPLEHLVPAAFLYCIAILAVTVPASLRRYRARTSD